MLKPAVSFFAATALALACFAEPPPASPNARQAEIRQVMCRVGGWMLEHRQETPGGRRPDTDWTVGAWYAGGYALYDLTREPAYLAPLLAMGKTTGWRTGPSPLFADDQCIAQTYLDLYMDVTPDPALIAHVRGVCDAMIAYPCDQPLDNHMSVCFKGEWSWCDALFMGPAVWAKLGRATGEKKYFEFLDRKWKKTSDFLYDPEEHLYFRDAAYLTKKEANGKKVFWGRGNGWVLAGLARVLEALPQEEPARPFYERQFKEMAEKIVACQQPDGLWRASLLDPDSFPLPETSGSGFYCYALAWGINSGLLDRAAYGPAVQRAWSALVACVTSEGKLTHVQPIGADPKKFDPGSTEVYGVGAFLLAGREVYRLAAEVSAVAPGFRMLPLAPLGPPNPWPRFRFQLGEAPLAASAALSAEDRAGMLTNATVAFLPYLTQDGYSRERQPGRLPTVELQNAALRAVFYPSLGGRMISLYDKQGRRELLFDNPVMQFANLGIRNAWFSGGVEWNGPLFGHSLLTCSPVFAGLIETPRGPLLRLYEFDRVLETAWQVDVFLPVRDDRLWVHVKAFNPNAHAVDFYWWSNIALPLTRETRVLSPADYALSHEDAGNIRLAFPVFDGFDGSFPANYPYAKSVFFRKPGSLRPWSVCVDGQGRGLSHVSTEELGGRKFFTWGNSRGGRRWMDFLSAPGRGDYLEMQGGVTPTQLQTRTLKAGASLEWTECYSPFAMDAAAAQSPDYGAACAAAGRVLEARVSAPELQAMHEFLRQQAGAPVQTLLHAGSGWGGLYERRTGVRISPGLRFERVAGGGERPWEELLTAGTFSVETLGESPCSFNVSEGWVQALSESARTRGPTWLHHLHLGVALLERGAFVEAQGRFKASAALQDNASARRCLALLAEREGDLDAADAAYQGAWALAGADASLAVERCGFLVRHQRYAAFHAFVKSLPALAAGHERIALLKAAVALAEGRYADVRGLLKREFCTLREGEVSLSELWFASHLKEAEKREGRELTVAEKQALKKACPPPPEIDFRMKE